ncbi:MAG: hypothetical protein ACYDDT_10830 [Sulfuricella sp.]
MNQTLFMLINASSGASGIVVIMKKPVSFIALLMLSGCATYHARPIKLAALMQSFAARTLDNPNLQRPPS